MVSPIRESPIERLGRRLQKKKEIYTQIDKIDRAIRSDIGRDELLAHEGALVKISSRRDPISPERDRQRFEMIEEIRQILQRKPAARASSGDFPAHRPSLPYRKELQIPERWGVMDKKKSPSAAFGSPVSARNSSSSSKSSSSSSGSKKAVKVPIVRSAVGTSTKPKVDVKVVPGAFGSPINDWYLRKPPLHPKTASKSASASKKKL